MSVRDIAIVGMGCRYPGANGLREYWRLLLNAERRFRPVPEQRWNRRLFFDPDNRRAVGKAYTDQVAFLDRVDDFDAAHFRIPPSRVRTMDPQHRQLLAVTREALQDAGWERRAFDRESTGVFFALSDCQYNDLAPDPEDVQPYTMPGTLLNMAAATVSQHYDLHGPSFVMDSACSSGLVALNEAVAHLRAGTCAEAIVGAAYLNLVPQGLISFAKVGALSANGQCRPFDRRADGFVLGEGIGVVLLRPLDEAMRAGDRVYAVIRGVGCSNDGTTDGPMTPRTEGQYLALRRAYTDARVSPRSVGFIEAHGTATVVGDGVELESLTRVRRDRSLNGEDADRPDPGCYLASVKALIGHSLTSSGLASLIKTALVLHHRVIVPQPETRVDPSIGLAEAGVRIPTEPLRWETASRSPRRAGVNSFGFGGTNVHVVLEQAPELEGGDAPAAESAQPELFLFSAGSPVLLGAYLEKFLETLNADPSMSLTAVAHTLATRELLRTRLAVVAAGPDELRARLATAKHALAKERFGAVGDGVHLAKKPLRPADRTVAMVFPGQGTQRPEMMLDLYRRFAVFRRTADELDTVVRAEVGFSVLDAVYGSAAGSEAGLARMKGTDVCQPLLGVLGFAAARLLESCGLRGQVLLGHSVGDFPAAALAGALDETSMVKLLATRGAIMRKAEKERHGGMLVVQAAPEQIESLCAGIVGVWPACYNDPGQIVLSGTSSALDELESRCAEASVRTNRLAVSNAFHSPLLDGVRLDVEGELAHTKIVAPERTFVSCIAGATCSDVEGLRLNWAEHATAPVRFGSAVIAAHEAGARVFVQICGGRSLLGTARRNLNGRAACEYVELNGEVPNAARCFLEAIGQLAVLGIEVNPLALFAERERLVHLPPFPLATKGYWLAGANPMRTDSRRPRQVDTDSRGAAKTEPVTIGNSGAVDMESITTDNHHRDRSIPVNEIVSLFREQLDVLRSMVSDSQNEVGLPPAPTATAPYDSLPRPVSGRPHKDPSTGTVAQAAEYDTAVREAVYEQIARVSAFPVDQLNDESLIVQELGFDSLMFTDLMGSFRRIWPQIPARPSDLPQRPTISEVTAMVATTVGARPTPAQSGPEPAKSKSVIPEATVRQERSFEEFADVREHSEWLDGIGRNPYFLMHEGNARDITRVGGRELLSFSSYNYLNLSGHPKVNEAVSEAVERYGSSVSASRFLSGDRPVHKELERELAALLGAEDAVVLVSGHATNVTVIGEMFGPGDLIVHDELAHNSILQGCALSGATRRSFPHNDVAALEVVLERHRGRYRRALVVVEGVYSMDGDIAELPALIEVKKRHGALLMVDEAHSIGVVGEHGGGVGEYFGVVRSEVDMWSGTLSKAMASCGGYVAGSSKLVEYLKYTSSGFVYSVGMTPPNAGAALAAIQTMRAEPERLVRLRDNSRLFLKLAKEAGVNTGDSYDTPVIPCIVGDSDRCLRLANALFDRGISTNPILYPAVAEELVRLRFFVTSAHTHEQIERCVSVLAEELHRLGVPG